MSPKIKVCHLSTVHPRYDGRIFHKECISLVNNNFQVCLLVADGLGHEMKSGIEILDIGKSKNRFDRIIFKPIRIFHLSLQQKAKIYHFHDPELMIIGLFLKLLNKRVIFDIHENVALSIITKTWIKRVFRTTFSRLYRFFEKIIICFFDLLILAEDSYLNYYPNKNSIVIHNFPVVNEIKILHKSFNKESVVKFIYVGLINENRGIFESIEIFERILSKGLNCRYDILGKFDTKELEDKIIKIISDSGLDNNIIIHGQLMQKEVKEYLKHAHFGFSLLFPIPNYKESLPTKIFEYMQFGIPVIASNLEIYKPYIINQNTGICVDLTDINSIIKDFFQMIENPNTFISMSKNGIDVISKKYNWNIEEEVLLKAYNNL
jgi:glycosyltransferase involved in cell wall biosynthesis